MSTGLRSKGDAPGGRPRTAQRYGTHGTSFPFYSFPEFAGCVECRNCRHSVSVRYRQAAESKMKVDTGEEEAVS